MAKDKQEKGEKVFYTDCPNPTPEEEAALDRARDRLHAERQAAIARGEAVPENDLTPLAVKKPKK